MSARPSRVFELRLTRVRCVDETEHEGPWPFKSEWIANDAMRAKALFIVEDQRAERTQREFPTAHLGDNYEDGTVLNVSHRLGVAHIYENQRYPLVIHAGVFLIEEDYFGDLGDVDKVIKDYAEAAKTVHSLASVIFGLSGDNPVAKIGSSMAKLASIVEPLVAEAIIAAGNDVFPPQDVSLHVPSFDAPLEPADENGVLTFRGHGGHYELTYQWRVTLVTDAWQPIGHANAVHGLAFLDGDLYAASEHNLLWKRDSEPRETNWNPIGHANHVTDLTSVDGLLFAVSQHNVLWSRMPHGDDATWRPIGEANGITAFTAQGDDRLFAASNHNLLWVRNSLSAGANWRVIGEANNVTAMAAAGDTLFAITRDNRLWLRPAVVEDTRWTPRGIIDQFEGHAVRSMTASDDTLFAVTADNRLWCRALPI